MIDQPLSILIIEDNAAMAANIYDYLEACGHTPDAAPDGPSGLGLIEQNRYDAVVLDWMLPRMDGLAVLARLRGELRSTLPVIMLTAKDRLENKIEGFEGGADDYLVKPVALPELEIRLRALVTRCRAAQAAQPAQALQIADLCFSLETLVVTRAGRVLPLTPIRRQILEALMRRSPQVVSRQQLEALVWGDSPPDGDILRSHMHLLRKAVDGDGDAKLMHTVPGIGYRLAADHAA